VTQPNDPKLRSFIPVDSTSDFPIQNLPYGVYDAKPEGFVPGCISLHNCMLPHGPDRQAFDHASNGELKPVKLTGTMAFMFETRFPQRVTRHAATSATLQADYAECWKGLEKRFDPNRP
jgi:homogentisate 1,2-dioxygenase